MIWAWAMPGESGRWQAGHSGYVSEAADGISAALRGGRGYSHFLRR